MIMADSVVAYFGEHSEFGYGKTGPALKSERGLIWSKPLECYNVLDLTKDKSSKGQIFHQIQRNDRPR